MPMAINIEKSIIPNEMRQLDTSWNDTTLTKDLQDASGVKYKFYVSNKEDFSDEVEKEIIGNADNSFTLINYGIMCFVMVERLMIFIH